MTIIELFSKDDCHLCEVAKMALKRIQIQHPFELREIKLREGDERYEEFKELFPVVYVDGEFAYQYRIPEVDLIARLQSKRSQER